MVMNRSTENTARRRHAPAPRPDLRAPAPSPPARLPAHGWARVLGALLLCAIGMQPGSEAQAPAGMIERVVATVGSEPILLSEVESRLAVEMSALQVDPADSAAVAELREQVLEALIEQRILVQEARQRELEVPEEEITAAVDQAIDRNKQQLGSERLFQLQLEREGLTEEELRRRFAEEARREILAARLVQRELGDQVQVTPEDVRAYYDEHRAELPQQEQAVRLQRIVLLVEPDSLTLARTRELAAGVADRIRAGEITFAQAALRYSDDPNGKDGGDLHRIQRGDLSEQLGAAFEAAAFDLEVGEISPPILTPLGFHLLRVSERDPQGEWIHLHHVLFGVPVLRADEARARERAEAVRARALAGESFDALARRFSATPEGQEGGHLGWVPVVAMDTPLQEALERIAPGETTDVIEVEGAYLILKLLEAQDEREFDFEEIEADLAEWVRAQRMEVLYSEWMEELKAEYYIERRPWE